MGRHSQISIYKSIVIITDSKNCMPVSYSSQPTAVDEPPWIQYSTKQNKKNQKKTGNYGSNSIWMFLSRMSTHSWQRRSFTSRKKHSSGCEGTSQISHRHTSYQEIRLAGNGEFIELNTGQPSTEKREEARVCFAIPNKTVTKMSSYPTAICDRKISLCLLVCEKRNNSMVSVYAPWNDPYCVEDLWLLWGIMWTFSKILKGHNLHDGLNNRENWVL